MMRIARWCAAAIACAAMTAFATPQPIDATGLWIKADESGWGVSVFHQGDTLFASLFVYGPDGQPKWYTASSMTGGPTVYSGALTEATGPYFGAGAFDPGAVSRRTVGTMTMTLDEAGAVLAYSVDGTQVSKRVARFTMRPLNLDGYYYGALVQPAGVAGSEIRVPNQEIDVYDQARFNLKVFSNDGSRSCTFDGATREQRGGFVAVSGLSGCGKYPAVIVDQPWSMNVAVTPHGFLGSFTGGGVTKGAIAAASRGYARMQGSGWLNDLWFPPAEAGWGLNLIEQGDNAFATLFVFDGQNRPKWYSASQLKASMQGFTLSWSGPLEETTGPYFGAAFNASAVTRRVVGVLALQVPEQGDALLTYTVEGVTVVKRLSRFAFRRNSLSGSYDGGIGEVEPGSAAHSTQFTIDDQGDRVSISIDVKDAPHCELLGTGRQAGTLRYVSGTYSCAGGAQGDFRLDNVMVTGSGLTASYVGPGSYLGLIRTGNIVAARR